MPDTMDYFHYYLSKYDSPKLPFGKIQVYKDIDGLSAAYEKSFHRLGDASYRNKILLITIQEFMSKDSKGYNQLLSIDANNVLKRSLQKITHANTNDAIFESLSDYLWIKASIRINENQQTHMRVHLTDNMLEENYQAALWLNELFQRIKNVKHQLKCMEETDKLSLGKKILPILINNPEVSWYNDNYSSSELKDQILEYHNIKKRLEFFYFAFIVTNIYNEQLRRRYRLW